MFQFSCIDLRTQEFSALGLFVGLMRPILGLSIAMYWFSLTGTALLLHYPFEMESTFQDKSSSVKELHASPVGRVFVGAKGIKGMESQLILIN